MSGYFLVSRDLVDPHHDLHPMTTGEDACRAFAWIDLIGMARWRAGGGLDRGELRASQRFLASRWNWGKKKVARFLGELEDEKRIERRRSPAPREPDRISICNYDTYQDQWFGDRTTSDTASRTASGTASAPKEETIKKKEEGRRETTHGGNGADPMPPPSDLPKSGGDLQYPPEFEEVWSIYPDREGGNPKKAAYRAWRARVRQGVDPVDLFAGVRRYRAYCEKRGNIGSRYVKQASTFFGPDEWWKQEWTTDGLTDGDRRVVERRTNLEDVDLANSFR